MLNDIDLASCQDCDGCVFQVTGRRPGAVCRTAVTSVEEKPPMLISTQRTAPATAPPLARSGRTPDWTGGCVWLVDIPQDETPCLFQSSNYEAGICSGSNFTETNSSDWSCITSLPPLPVTGYYWAGMDLSDLLSISVRSGVWSLFPSSDGTEDGTSLEDCCSLCQTASHVDFQSGEEGSSGTCYCSTPGEVTDTSHLTPHT